MVRTYITGSRNLRVALGKERKSIITF